MIVLNISEEHYELIKTLAWLFGGLLVGHLIARIYLKIRGVIE